MATWPAKTNYATGDVLTAAQMQDIGNALNSVESAQYAAGKNKIINGDFRINQRSFSSGTTTGTFIFDRWQQQNLDGTCTFSAQTFTPGAAPVAGYESINYARAVTSGQTATSALAIFTQRIEDVRTFAGETITVSFWAQSGSGTPSISIELDQQFGSGGSTRVTTFVAKKAITTSWVRYTASVAVPSISGKTIGTSSYLGLGLWVSAGTDFNARTNSLGIQSNTFNIWGVQVEAGSSATPFQTATGTLQGELAACQRYYYKWVEGKGSGLGVSMGIGVNYSATQANLTCVFPVTMRTNPTLVATTGSAYYKFERNGAQDDFNSLTIFHSGVSQAMLYNNTEISGTAGQAGSVSTENNSASVAFSAEL